MSFFINVPGAGSPSWKDPVAASASLPATGNQAGDARVTIDTGNIWVWTGTTWVDSATGATGGITQLTGDVTAGPGTGSQVATVAVVGGQAVASIVAGDILYGSGSGTLSRLAKGSNTQVLTLASGLPSWATASGGSGVTTVGSFSGSAQPNGGSISGTTITFGPADTSNPGDVSVGSTTDLQTITGQKKFNAPATYTITGTTTSTATSPPNGFFSVTISGGAATTDLVIGDEVALSSAASTFVRVVGITSNTVILVSAPVGNGTSQTIVRRRPGLVLSDNSGTVLAQFDGSGSILTPSTASASAATPSLLFETGHITNISNTAKPGDIILRCGSTTNTTALPSNLGLYFGETGNAHGSLSIGVRTTDNGGADDLGFQFAKTHPGLGSGYQLLMIDGAANSPPYSFFNDHTTGMYRTGSVIAFQWAGATVATLATEPNGGASFNGITDPLGNTFAIGAYSSHTSLIPYKWVYAGTGGIKAGFASGATSQYAASAIGELVSTTLGWLEPRMTTTQVNAISSPAEALQVYDTTVHSPKIYDGVSWNGLHQLPYSTLSFSPVPQTGYISFGNNISIQNTTVHTWAGWVNISPTQFSATATILSKFDGTTGYALQLQSVTSSGAQFFAHYLHATGTNEIQVRSASNTIPVGQWVHLAFTYDGTSTAAGCKLYVNGVASTLSTVSDTLSLSITNADPLYFGYEGQSRNSPLTGVMNNWSYYTAALSSGNVTTIYNNGRTVDLTSLSTNSNLSSWWKLGNGDSATSFADSKGAITGTGTGTTLANIVPDYPGNLSGGISASSPLSSGDFKASSFTVAQAENGVTVGPTIYLEPAHTGGAIGRGATNEPTWGTLLSYNGSSYTSIMDWGAKIGATGLIFTQHYGAIVPSADNSLSLGFNTNATTGTARWKDLGLGSNLSVGITAAYTASACVEFASTTKGVLLPRMTTTQVNAISSPATGLLAYDTTLNQQKLYNGTAWAPLNTGLQTFSREAGAGADRSGSGTLSGGTATITTSAAATTSRIFVTDTSTGSLVNVGSLVVSTKGSGSFIVTSTNALDASTFDWFIITPY